MFSRSVAFSFSVGLAVLPYVSATVYNVDVGKDGLTFTPGFVNAVPGDQVVFTFHPKNHTVTQSSFANPCGALAGGFDSGFMPVAADSPNNVTALPTYTIPVNDTNPIWLVCQQAANTPASHCGAGMVFAVNCPVSGEKSLTNFQNAALAVGASLKAAASSSTAAAPTATTDSSSWAYGDATLPPAVTPTLVTETVTLDQSSTWTTTYSSYPGSPDPTPASAQGDVIKVTVGENGLTFNPPTVSAKPRDVIMFEFHAKNHTVTQSTFADPCHKSNATDAFDSGFMPVNASLTNGPFPTWNLTVNDTNPIWVYCKQKVPASHCAQGMVFAINSVEDSAHNFSAFQNIAKQFQDPSSSSSNTSSSASPSASAGANEAMTVRVGTAGIVVVVAGLVALL